MTWVSVLSFLRDSVDHNVGHPHLKPAVTRKLCHVLSEEKNQDGLLLE